MIGLAQAVQERPTVADLNHAAHLGNSLSDSIVSIGKLHAIQGLADRGGGREANAWKG